MNGALTFSASWPVIAISALAWVVLVGFGFLNWKRSAGRRGVVGLEVLRLALAALVVVTLWRPELKRTTPTSDVGVHCGKLDQCTERSLINFFRWV